MTRHSLSNPTAILFPNVYSVAFSSFLKRVNCWLGRKERSRKVAAVAGYLGEAKLMADD